MSLKRPWLAECDGCGTTAIINRTYQLEAWRYLIKVMHWHRAWFQGNPRLTYCPECWPKFEGMSGLNEITTLKEGE